MKLLVSLLLLLTTSAGLAAQESPPNLTRDGLKGPVKTVDSGTINYLLKDGKPVQSARKPVQTLRFDERGNRIEATTFDPNGSISQRLVYTYDALGRNTGYDEYYRLANKAMGAPRKHIYTLDHNGKIVEMILYEADGSVGTRFTYKYDGKGNKVEYSITAWTGARIGRITYTHDAEGNVLTESSHDANDAISWKRINLYDAQGRTIEWTQYQNQVLRYKKLFKYDDKGRIAEEETFEFNAKPNVYITHAPEPGKVVYTYNDKRRSKEIGTYDATGALKTREVRTFDEHGNQVSWEFYNADGSARPTEINFYENHNLLGKLSGKSHTQIQYDSQGNWTKKIHLIWPEGAKEPQPWRADYRDITYYKD